MLFQLPDAYVGLDLYQGINLPFWIGFLGLLCITAILFFVEGSKRDMKSQKMMNYGYGVFISFFAILRVFFMMGVYTADICLACYDFYTNLGYISGIIGVIFLLYVLETYMVPKTKKIFLIISVIAFAICLIGLFTPAGRELALDFIYFLMPLSVGFIIILYIYMYAKTTGVVRKKSKWILIGLIVIVIGHMMDTQFFIAALPQIPLYFAPITMSIGVIIFLVSQFKIK